MKTGEHEEPKDKYISSHCNLDKQISSHCISFTAIYMFMEMKNICLWIDKTIYVLLFSNSLDLNKENLHLTFSQTFCLDRYRNVSL